VKITTEILEACLHCKLKGHLKLAGRCGTRSEYEEMTREAQMVSRQEALAHLIARFSGGDGYQGSATVSVLKQGAPLLADIAIEDECLSLRLDALMRVDGASELGAHHYAPVLHCHGPKVGRHQKLLIAVQGLALGGVQGKVPDFGLVARGAEGRLGKVRLDAKLYRQAQQVLDELKRLQAGGEAPRLMLNRHCHACEFRQRCRAEAEKDDDLSLLQGMTEVEIGRQNSKGIFTVRQLFYTFRVRRRNKRAKKRDFPRSFALQALAIRENKIHVHGSYAVPSSPASVYLDIEGLPDRGTYYLIGLVVADGVESRHSFWADGEADQPAIFDRLLEKLNQYTEHRLFHFGDYESRALLRIRSRLAQEQQEQLDKVLVRAVNVLSIIGPYVYFPTHSCGLKDIGRSIGCVWSEPDASGLQSVVWRTAWERSRDESVKERLLRYNEEDCLALKAVVDLLARIAPAEVATGDAVSPTSSEVVRTDDLPKAPGRRHQFGKKDSCLPGFDYVNQCAYFDHQRDKVFARTNPRLKAVKRRRKGRPSARINKVVELACERCPACNSRKIRQAGLIARKIIDLKFPRDGVKRWVTQYRSWNYICEKCGSNFTHPEFP
jgi:predicted RecB family nuclease